jgi:hypothetical protein
MEPRNDGAETAVCRWLGVVSGALQHPALRITSRMYAMLPTLGSAELTLEACAVYPNGSGVGRGRLATCMDIAINNISCRNFHQRIALCLCKLNGRFPGLPFTQPGYSGQARLMFPCQGEDEREIFPVQRKDAEETFPSPREGCSVLCVLHKEMFPERYISLVSNRRLAHPSNPWDGE